MIKARKLKLHQLFCSIYEKISAKRKGLVCMAFEKWKLKKQIFGRVY